MSERRKIIIETGAGSDEPLPTPHFDAEATLTARPVVPLADQEIYQRPYGNYTRRADKPFWKRPALLALIVLIAISVGVAAGLAIGIYRNRTTAEAPVATAPSSTVEGASADQQVVESPQPAPMTPARAAVPDEPEESEAPQAEPKDEPRERTARNEQKDDDDEVRPPVEVKQPAVREKQPAKTDDDNIEVEREARRAEKEQRREERREERRERRRGRDNDENAPRGIERVGREVDRIREIFEGRQP